MSSASTCFIRPRVIFFSDGHAASASKPCPVISGPPIRISSRIGSAAAWRRHSSFVFAEEASPQGILVQWREDHLHMRFIPRLGRVGHRSGCAE